VVASSAMSNLASAESAPAVKSEGNSLDAHNTYGRDGVYHFEKSNMGFRRVSYAVKTDFQKPRFMKNISGSRDWTRPRNLSDRLNCGERYSSLLIIQRIRL